MAVMLRRSALNTLAACLLVSGLTASPAVAQSSAHRSSVKVTELLVLEWCSVGTNRFVMTADSIRVIQRDQLPEDPQTHYARALTRGERDRLLAPLDQLYLSRLRPTYEGISDLSDGCNYDFSIRKGEYIKETRLINYSLGPFLTFTHRLNALLPPAFRLFYGQP